MSIASRPILFVLVLALAAPAAAQIVGRRDYGPPPRPPGTALPDSRTPVPSPRRETGEIRRRIEQGRDSGTLSAREARHLRRESRRLDRLTSTYARDGLSASERAELETRARVLRSRVDGARHR